MATLDDKLLGEKLHYYCSSSEDEKEGDDDEIGEESPFVTQNDPAPVSKWNGSSCNVNIYLTFVTFHILLLILNDVFCADWPQRSDEGLPAI